MSSPKRLVLAVIATTLTLASCVESRPPGFDPQRSDITEQRGIARLATADQLSLATGQRLSTASAQMDSCQAAPAELNPGELWSYRCTFTSSAAISLPDATSTASMLRDGLGALNCADPTQLDQLINNWAKLNPGEPLPGTDQVSAAVLPPQFHRCGQAEVWIRFSAPADPLLATTAAQAARTFDPVVVTARPFSDEAMTDLAASPDPVVVLVTVSQDYWGARR